MADTTVKKYHLDNIDLKEAFEMFDADDDGEIDVTELGKVEFNWMKLHWIDWIDCVICRS